MPNWIQNQFWFTAAFKRKIKGKRNSELDLKLCFNLIQNSVSFS